MRRWAEVRIVAVGGQPQGAERTEGAEGGKGREEEGRTWQGFLGAVKELVISHQHLREEKRVGETDRWVGRHTDKQRQVNRETGIERLLHR